MLFYFLREKQKRGFCGGAAPNAPVLWRSRSVAAAANPRRKPTIGAKRQRHRRQVYSVCCPVKMTMAEKTKLAPQMPRLPCHSSNKRFMTILSSSPRLWKAENGVQTNLYFGESRRTGFRATAGEGAYLRRRSAVAQGGVCDRTRSRYQFPLCGFRPREHTSVADVRQHEAEYVTEDAARISGAMCLPPQRERHPDRARSPYQPRYMPSP